jgi:hypothetical protein
MIYLKSAIAGIVAVFAAAILTLFAIVAYLSIAYRSTGNEAIGWDPVSLAKPLTWLVVLGIYLAGFFWEFRRARSK